MYTLRIFSDPILRDKAYPVDNFQIDSLDSIVQNMKKIMQENGGIGLAANQIGILKRIIILTIEDNIITLVNPEIVERKKDKEVMNEGCLSIPELRVDIERHKKIVVRGFDIEGKVKEVLCEDLSARAVQHEIDHLNGVLIIDRMERDEKLQFLLSQKRE